MRVYLEYAHTLDPLEWEQQYEAGLVPDRLPYGLDRLDQHGFQVSYRRPLRSPAGRRVAAVARRLSGGFELVGSLSDRGRRESDVSVCWDERSGVPASLRSRLPGEPPAVTGTLWATEPNGLGATARHIATAGFRRAASIWANTDAQLDVLRSWGIPPRQLNRLLMGVDSDFWQAADTLPETGLVVGAGNDRHRDHEALVRALVDVSRRRADVRLELVTRQAVEVPRELGRRIHHLSHPELRELYGRAAVVVVALKPNLHLSGSTVILEAMACGRPVVATATTGVQDYVRDGETGLIVPSGDEAALAAAVEALLDDPERARELGRAGRRLLEQQFSTEVMVASLAEILRSIPE
jgi:glycosyltransferase involved in cell wall biosynthesis